MEQMKEYDGWEALNFLHSGHTKNRRAVMVNSPRSYYFEEDGTLKVCITGELSPVDFKINCFLNNKYYLINTEDYSKNFKECLKDLEEGGKVESVSMIGRHIALDCNGAPFYTERGG